MFGHSYANDLFAVSEMHIVGFVSLVPARFIEGNTWESCHHFSSGEARCEGLSFATVKDRPADTLSSRVRVNEEGAYPGWMSCWIEQRRVPRFSVVARPVKCLPPAPSAASHNPIAELGNKIRTVLDQLMIHPEHGPDRELDLRIGVNALRETAYRIRDQFPDSFDVGGTC